MVDPSGTFEFYDFAAGWCSGICGLLVGHPADTVKVRQQITGTRNAFSVVYSIFKTEGPLGFYKGLFMPLMTAGVMNSVFFGCYGNSVRLFAKFRDEIPKRTCCDSINTRKTYDGFHYDVFFSGCIAGFITTLGACPFELVKVKLQTQYEHLKKCKKKHMPHEIYTGSFDCLLKLYQAGGIRSIYKGLVPMLWRDISASGIYMYIYVFGSECISETKTPSSVMITGAIAGALSWVFIIPLDVVKSRIQADNRANPYYKSMMDCFRKTYKEGGLKIFMTGFGTTIFRALPVNAATFFGYETFISMYLKYVKPSASH